MLHPPPSPRRSAPCPLCFTPVVARELRLVRIRAVNPPRPGQQLTMTLIRRTRTSIIPQPVAAVTAAAGASALGAEAAGAGAGAGSGRESGDGGGGAKGKGGKEKEKGKGREKERVQEEAPSPFDRNLFAKFVVVGSGHASELWRAAAEQLAACANQVGCMKMVT